MRFMRRAVLPASLLCAVIVTACSADGAGSLAPDIGMVSRTAAPFRSTASARWNAVLRPIARSRETGPLGLARSFALVSVAQYNAVIAAEQAKDRGSHPSRAAAVASASAAVIAALYPLDQALIDAQLASDAANAQLLTAPDEDWESGFEIGRSVAAAVMARAATDGSNAVFTGTLPTGPGLWYSAPLPARPVAPLWGQVRPWLMESGDQLRPAAPPTFGSPEFQAALAEVRHYSDTRTAEQLQIARFWGVDINASGGPMGYFSIVGLELAEREHFDERRTARMLALMHMAGMDASIACWDAKYHYMLLRPYQADPAITTPVGRPNFPSYPSAHSCLSAAYVGVLAGLFPAAADDLNAEVVEAGWARIYAGLHYDFDVAAGRQIGFGAAQLALEKAPLGMAPVTLD